jgi:zinc transport system substrate-binding protein
MIKVLKYSLLLSTFLMFISCNNREPGVDEKTVSVSILPQKYFTGAITGPEYKINVLIPPGASPASYEPSPGQLHDLGNSDLYIRVGEIAFEKVWIEKFQKENSDIPFYDVSKDIDLIYSEDHDHNHHEGHAHGHDHRGADPHIWMSPENAQKIAKATYQALLDVFPRDSSKFLNNYQALQREILKIDSLYQENEEKLKGRNFLIYHPALTYLSRDYGMKQHVLEYEGKEPPPSHIAKVIEEARANQIDFIFIQKEFNKESAESLAREINAEVIQIDPLNENWPEVMKAILHDLTK